MNKTGTGTELALERFIFGSRWLLTPFYIGLVAAIEPLVAQIAQLTNDIRSALHDHPVGETLSSLLRAPNSAICPATSTSLAITTENGS